MPPTPRVPIPTPVVEPVDRVRQDRMREASDDRALRALVAASPPDRLPLPRILGIEAGDDVEFLSANQHGSANKRGRVTAIEDRGFLLVMEPPPPAQRPGGIRGRPKAFHPHQNDIRRVYRGGAEVARLPWLLDPPVPKTPDIGDDFFAHQAKRWPPMEVQRALPEPSDLPPVFEFQIDDIVSYKGRGGGVYKAKIASVIYPPNGVQAEIRVQRDGGGSSSHPSPKNVVRVWRNNHMVALRADYKP